MAVTITITIDDAGRFGIQGPLENKVVCYGMLEAGKDAVRQFNEKQTQGRPLIAPVSVIPDLTAVRANGKAG
jgi:hypothetical protein